MFAKPQTQHHWLDCLVGQWQFSHQCIMGPDQPATEVRGTATIRSLGGLWIVVESSGGQSQEESWTSLMTIGFDPKKDRYVGSFVGSMMAQLWVYDGQLDEGANRLVLDAEGPAFSGEGLASYQDIIEIVDRDHWILRSQVLDGEGRWQSFMEGHHHRVS